MGFISALKGLSVVLPVLLSTMATLMASGPNQNMLIQKVCCPMGPPDDINKFICPDTTIMDYITGILTVKGSIQGVVGALCGFSFGFLRDLTGRSKILMYVGVTGELISACACFGSAYFWNSSPWILPMIQAFSSGGFGESIMQMGALCILMAESTQEELPLRMQVYVVSTLTMSLVGSFVQTVILTTYGYLWHYSFCIAMDVVALLLLIILIKNKGYERKPFKESVEGLKKVFKWRENVVVLWLMLLALVVSPAILASETMHNVKYMQVLFRFSLYQNLVLSTIGFGITIIGSFVGPMIFRKVFHMKELSMGILIWCVNSVSAFVHAFITTEVLLYLGAFAYFLKLAALPLPNSVITTIVDDDELGIYLGINAILTTFVPLGISWTYQYVAAHSKSPWLGAFFFVSSGCFLLLAILYSVSYCLYVEPKNKEDPEDPDSTERLRKNSENVKTRSPEFISQL